MTNRIKGYLVTLEGDIREDDAEIIKNALKMVRGVHNVRAYIKGIEDYMSEDKGRLDQLQEIFNLISRKHGEILSRKIDG